MFFAMVNLSKHDGLNVGTYITRGERATLIRIQCPYIPTSPQISASGSEVNDHDHVYVCIPLLNCKGKSTIKQYTPMILNGSFVGGKKTTKKNKYWLPNIIMTAMYGFSLALQADVGQSELRATNCSPCLKEQPSLRGQKTPEMKRDK